MKSEYKLQLQDNNWKQKRVEILKRDDKECQMCMSKKNVHVHHKKYIQGRKVWEYENNYLITVCELCHAKHHKKPKLTKKVKEDIKRDTLISKFKYSKNDQKHLYYQNLKEGAKRHGV